MTLHLEREIGEQPDVIRRLLSEEAGNVRQIAQAIQDFDPVFVSVAARGTSDNAGRYAQYLMGAMARLPVALAAPSLHTLYQAPPNLARALVIGISQSGRAEDVRRVVQDARAQGALTVSITNDPTSPLAQEAHYHLPLLAGEERSVAATKTYTAQLTVIAMLVAALIGDDELHTALAALPDQVARTLEEAEAIAEWIADYREMRHFLALGRGYNYCTAFEISLKLKELCYVLGEEYSEADFRHGPIALVEAGLPALVVAPSGKPLPLLVDLLKKLKEGGAECLVISNDEQTIPYARRVMRLPPLPEWVSPIPAVLPGQVLALRLALAKGYSVDQPRGLTKVTVTT